MKVRFFSFIRDYTGCSEADIPFHATIFELITFLCDQFGDEFRQKIFQNEDFCSEINILVNGKHVKCLQGAATPLSPDDCVEIIPFIIGG